MIETKQLHLSQRHARALVQHAQRDAPNEACGVLAGQGERVMRVYPVTNADHSPTTYRLDPEEQYRAYVKIEERGWEVVGVYHSHTHAPAYPSPTDIEQAYFPEAVHLILSLADPDQPLLRGFRIVEGQVEELGLEISENEEA